MRHLSIFRTTLVLFAVLLVAGATAAFAIPSSASHAAPSATYTGWGYTTSTGAATVAAWKWASTGWVATTFPTGASVWISPWGSGWSWVYRSGAWHAMKSDAIATWKCDSVVGDPYVYSTTLRGTLNVKQYNSSTAANATQAQLYDRVTLLCNNGFKDASGGDTVFAMVKVESFTTCNVWADACWLSPTLKSTVTGYVDASKLSDLPTAPPDGTFGEFPE